jgi:squalene synthase HpnC
MTEAGLDSRLSVEPALLASKARAENFPVAARLLPASMREELTAVYGFARFVDDLGDELPGTEESLAALDEASAELDRAFRGFATHPVFVRLMPILRRHAMSEEPFRALIEANRQDQSVTRYETFDDLLGYCKLSANPVGRIVLTLAGSGADPKAAKLSDDVCSALQVIEHLQDVQEDAIRGRVYLPRADMRRFGVTEDELVDRSASPRLRHLVAFETTRAKAMLESAPSLLRRLRGPWRVAVAGYAGGGLAQTRAIECAGYDVLERPVKATKASVALSSARLLVGGPG